MPLAAHPAFAAHAGTAPAFRPHMTAVTAPTDAVTEAHSVAAVMAAAKAASGFLDPLGSSHMVLSSFT